MRKIFLIAIAFLMISFFKAWAADYYVDCDGSDSNNGLSESTPFGTTNPIEGVDFLQAGDRVKIKAGCTWSGVNAIVSINSHGTASDYIIFEKYGTGDDPIFDGSVSTVDVPSWSGWTIHDAAKGIWRSNVAIPWQVNVVIVDGSYTLSSPFLSFQNISLLQNVSSKFVHVNAGQVIYVRLSDSSDPNNHQIRFGRQITPLAGKGLWDFSHVNGGYIEVHDIHVKGSNAYGFTSSNPYIKFIDCTAEFSARENFYFIHNGYHSSLIGADHNSCLRCLANYANSWGHNSQGGAGQNITIESPYVDIIDSEIRNGWMAGIDFLRYPTFDRDPPTPVPVEPQPFYGRVINSSIHDNSQRSKTTFDVGGFDSEILIDGGSDIQLINNQIYKTSGYSSGNAAPGITLSTEYVTYGYLVQNIEIINNLLYGLNGQCFTVTAISGGVQVSAPIASNIKVIGNTCVRGSYFNLFSFNNLITTLNGGLGIYLYNNIFYHPAASTIGSLPSGDLLHSANNLYFNTHPQSYILNNSFTLSAWQSLTGKEIGSVFANPQFISGYRLKNVLSGDSTTSPAVNSGDEGILSGYIFSSLGSTRTDNVIDESNNVDIGYHYNFVWDQNYGFIEPEAPFSYGNYTNISATNINLQ